MQNPPRGQALAPAGQGECSTPIPLYQAFYRAATKAHGEFELAQVRAASRWWSCRS